MNRTADQLRRFLAALPASGYDLGILGERGMYRLEAITADRILRMLPYLKHRNANGAHIYLRPTGESAYTLLDDLTAATLPRLSAEGFAPAAVVETSPDSFQAWIRHTQPLSKELGTLAAKLLAAQFRTDTSAADWRRFGRAPGFTNRKPQHRDAQGCYPFARLHTDNGQPFPSATTFHAHLLASHRQVEVQRTASCLRFAGQPHRFAAPLTLTRFRAGPRYAGRPAAADMAFSICAYAYGWSESDIAAALTRDYLSSDTNPARQTAYIRRTLAKAMRWAA